ncbi:Bifunctional uridylyltransferase/uridylyl-removing enzyme [Aquimixticola soesokkakensis]|uniref:Bifunctional uridylyltransferase/uridylyl-removing enzyme n=1 Tax=Aquimixticola soesokkakensis TaxID=1519096 RepID=A0A1Y5T0Z9_9RHOB|nr:[protein-PII] uridylyltransferase [Aquimixticola soesokkakensis]SLN53135.1 Bifunctional uridylyltransferase/uridylyl-removing enzyme [Aquimixticola soesokkakensis]
MTLPHAPSVALASEPALTTTILPPPEDLICDAAAIFDIAAASADLETAIDAAQTPADVRKVTVQILSEANTRGRAAIAAGIAKRPLDARPAVLAYAWLTDCLVGAVLWVASVKLHPIVEPSDKDNIAVLAVGGYGRREMSPFSDVDLLFLSPAKITGRMENLIESMLYMFWDLHLKVGHASRTVKECLTLGREDFTIRTAMLELRFLAGDLALKEKLLTRLRTELFRSTGPEFVTAKLEERTERLKKQGNQRYVVEPNVKEGKGGLRDLQSLYWIAKYVNDVRVAADLVDLGVFTREEYAQFRQAENFLMATRNALHLAANRGMDQLTFDMQPEVAERLGYVDIRGRRAVEVFMQDYFRHATRVGELTRILLAALEAQHLKPAPSLQRMLSRTKKVGTLYKIVHNRLALVDPQAFLADKLNMIRIFNETLRTGYLIHPDAMRLIAANLRLIDDDMRRNPEANRIFFDIMLKHGNPERGLRRMNEIGVLGAFIPEFQNIVAMMQFNMYHSYTVDEHTIQCIKTLAEIEKAELVEELPIASGILKDGVNRKVIYVALLLHDIGKGRPEDHSIIGAQIARRICPRLGLKPAECETVEWLVRYHLLMSDIAQKRDISDPRTVRDFAKAVRSRSRLDLLTVLTVCDIRGVGPNTWNNWKAQLLRNLHRQTALALEGGMEALNREAREGEAKRHLREALTDWEPAAIKRETQRHYGPYWQGLPTSAHVIFANLLKDMRDDEIHVDLMPDEDRDATRACFALVDHPGIFSRLAGAIALVGANVVDARTFTSKDGYATAIFWIQDGDESPYDTARLPRLKQMISKTLRGEVVARDALKDRDKIKKRESKFNVPTSISFDNEGSEIFTIVEVDTRDRPGLLYDLTRALAANNITISTAQIATYGAQVVDSFYVKDMFGMKLHSETRLKALEKKLREAITRGAERARAK